MKWLALAFLLTTALLPAQEPLTIETVAANRKLWPREVTVTAEHQVPVVVKGKTSGTMKAPAGRTYPVLAITAAGVQVNALGTPLTLPADQTDLLARVEIAQADSPTAPSAEANPASSPKPTPAAKSPAAAKNTIAAALDGQLVTRIGTKLEPLDAKKLANKRYLAIYYAASWCQPSRQFTPELVKWYKAHKNALETFDLIFVSRDRAPEDMEKFMRDDKIDWPALSYEAAQGQHPLRKYAGRGTPCLVLLDETGQLLSDSYQGDNYLGPAKVLHDLDQLLRAAQTP